MTLVSSPNLLKRILKYSVPLRAKVSIKPVASAIKIYPEQTLANKSSTYDISIIESFKSNEATEV